MIKKLRKIIFSDKEPPREKIYDPCHTRISVFSIFIQFYRLSVKKYHRYPIIFQKTGISAIFDRKKIVF